MTEDKNKRGSKNNQPEEADFNARTETETTPMVPHEDKKIEVKPDKVVVGKKTFTLHLKTKILLGLGLVGLVLALLANTLQRYLFQGADSLIFLPKGGLLSAPLGVVLLFAGATALFIALKSLITKKGRLQSRQKWMVALAGLLVMVLGFSAFFRYVDFKENTIVDRSFLVTRAYTYLDVNEVNVSSNRISDNETILTYEYRMVNGRGFEVKVTGGNMMEIKKIDTRIRSTVKRSIDNFSIQEMERLGMYTREEALRIFVIE